MSTTDAPADDWAIPTRYLPPTEPTRRADGALLFSGLTYAAPPGYRPLQLDAWVPEAAKPPPLVVWVHGGGWMFGDRRHLPETLRPGQVFDELLDAGLAVASVDYRHALESPFPAQLHDVKAAVRYLREHAGVLGIDMARIGIWGESAGGHLAALVGLTAHRPDLEGDEGVVGGSSAVNVVVDWYGPADLSTMPRQPPPPHVAARLPAVLLVPLEDRLLDGVDEATAADASPVTHVMAGAPPFLLVHGTADSLVPFSQSEQLASALTAAGVDVEVVAVQNAEHIFNGCTDVDAVVQLSVQHLADALGVGAGE